MRQWYCGENYAKDSPEKAAPTRESLLEKEEEDGVRRP
jgi:hypothetical protein